MEFKIKPATINNLKDIQKLNLLLLKELNKNCNQTNDCAWSNSKNGKEYFKKRIVDKNSCAFIVKINNKVIGYLVGSIQEKQVYRTIQDSADIDSFFVLDEFRSQNIGSQLFKKFKKWCNSKNISRISVTTPVKNTRAIEFYKKQGFVDYDLILESIIK